MTTERLEGAAQKNLQNQFGKDSISDRQDLM